MAVPLIAAAPVLSANASSIQLTGATTSLAFMAPCATPARPPIIVQCSKQLRWSLEMPRQESKRMRGLGKIVRHLNELRGSVEAENANGDDRLGTLTGFGANPGGLDCRIFLPAGAPRALVVVLHGCTQGASVYDRGSGWSKLAEEYGFALLYPQQRRANNPNLCFNWYVPQDARRGRGEAASISQMIQHAAARLGIDRSRTFVTGLSAGGAMTAVMLAAYPELFAGGAIIAGLPFAVADTLPEALASMRGQGLPRRQELAARARAAAPSTGRPPTVSVWHGTHDRIVDPVNATAIVNQWRDLHGLGDASGQVEAVAGHRREVWRDSQGQLRVERYDIKGMGHGIPLKTGDREGCGRVGPHMLEAGLCSTRRIASSWGLLAERSDRSTSRAAIPAVVERPALHSPLSATPRPAGVGAVIENALRSAGLMR